MLSDQSNVQLLVELLENGGAGVSPAIEPIPATEILSELQRRTGRDLGQKVEAWSAWALQDDRFSNQGEKKTLITILKIDKIEDRALKKLSGRS